MLSYAGLYVLLECTKDVSAVQLLEVENTPCLLFTSYTLFRVTINNKCLRCSGAFFCRPLQHFSRDLRVRPQDAEDRRSLLKRPRQSTTGRFSEESEPRNEHIDNNNGESGISNQTASVKSFSSYSSEDQFRCNYVRFQYEKKVKSSAAT